MLKLICGNSGSGKSEYIYQSIHEMRSLYPEKKIICIVPEQKTHDTEIKLIEKTKSRGLLYTEVLSFKRLAFRLFADMGHDSDTVLSEISKSMLLRHIVHRLTEENGTKKLQYFGKKARFNGYISKIKSCITELKSYGIGVDDLREILTTLQEEKERSLLTKKLEDIFLIYEEFDHILKSNHTIASEYVLELAIDLLQEKVQTRVLDHAAIYIDGFYDFSYYQYKLIEEILKRSEQVSITICIDADNISGKRRDKLFALSRYGYEMLMKTAKRVSVPLEVHTLEKSTVRTDIQELESHIFRYSLKEEEKREVSDIFLERLKYPEDEIQNCIKHIRRIMLEDQNIKYKNIAIVCGDISFYAKEAAKVFERSGIPIFIDHKQSIAKNTFIQYIKVLCKLIYTDFERTSFIKLLRFGYLFAIDVHRERCIDAMDNFLLVTGLRGYASFHKHWEMDTDEERNQEWNAFKADIMEHLDEVYQVFKKGKRTVREYSEILIAFLNRTFLDEAYIEDVLENIADTYQSSGEYQSASEYRQVYRIFISLIDELVSLMGDVEVDLEEYIEILNSGFEESKIGTIPEDDAVILGDIVRSKLEDITHLFVIGMNDNMIPKVSERGDIITDEERSYLSGKQIRDRFIELSPTSVQRLENDIFAMYTVLSKPSQSLYLMYHELDTEGKVAAPSYILDRITGIFRDLKAKSIDTDTYENVIGVDYGRDRLIAGIQAEKAGEALRYYRELLEFYKNPEVAEKLELKPAFIDRLLKDDIYAKHISVLDKEILDALYKNGTDWKDISISQLESFAACQYKYFLQYGLHLQPRRVHDIKPDIIGNLMHDALEALVDENFVQLTSDMEQTAEKIFDEVVESYITSGNFISSRNQMYFKNYKNVFVRTAKRLQKQLQQGEYQKIETEYRFEVVAPVKMRGFIDRMDITDTSQREILQKDENGEFQRVADREYIRIVDYKTGIHKPDFEEMYYGLQLQLIVYMKALQKDREQKTKKEIIPMGIFYYNIQDKFNEIGDLKEIDKEYLPEGIYIEDDIALYMTDKSLYDESTEEEAQLCIDKQYIKRNQNTSEAFQYKASGNKDMRSIEEFATLMEYGEYKVKALFQERNAGEISPNPYQKGNKKPCDFCEYHSICGFRISDGEFRYLENESDRDIMLEKMREVLDKEEESHE